MITTIAKLKVGQRFSWIPADWYGPATLIDKYESTNRGHFNLKYDAKVVNPPGVSYGVPGSTRVRLLKPLSKKRSKS